MVVHHRFPLSVLFAGELGNSPPPLRGACGAVDKLGRNATNRKTGSMGSNFPAGGI